jgi:hypothetical protein
MLPSSIFRTEVGPLNLYQSYGSIPYHFDLPVQYAQWLDLKIFFSLHLNQIPINNMVRIMQIFFQQRDMKHIMHIHGRKKFIMYEIGPILSNISNGPQNIAANFVQRTNFNELFLGFTFKSTCFPTLNSLAFSFLSS